MGIGRWRWMKGRLATALIAIALWLAPSRAMAHKDDYLDDTFVYLTLARRELELEYWVDRVEDPTGARHTFGVEYGLTDHLMADASGRWFQFSSGLNFAEAFFEL